MPKKEQLNLNLDASDFRYGDPDEDPRGMFEPVGAQARWRTIYDELKTVPVGGILSYETMAVALSLDPLKDRNTIQVAMQRAAKELELVDLRAVDVVRNVGYRVVEAREHLTLAQRHQKKSIRSLKRGKSKLDNVDLSLVPEEIRPLFQAGAEALARQMDFNRRTSIRQDRLERGMSTMSKTVERNEDETAKLAARLDRLDAMRRAEGKPTSTD